MKKLIALFTLCASSTTFATGLYIGGQIGIAAVDAINNGDLPISNSSFIGGIYGGYEYDFDSFFLAFEGEASFSDAKSTKRYGNTYSETNRGNIYGLTVLAGFPLNQYIDLYGRFGWTRTPFELKDSTGYSDEYSKNGATFGAGLRYNLGMNERFGLRFDYRYIKYSDIHFSEQASKLRVNDQLFSAGLQYNF